MLVQCNGEISRVFGNCRSLWGTNDGLITLIKYKFLQKNVFYAIYLHEQIFSYREANCFNAEMNYYYDEILKNINLTLLSPSMQSLALLAGSLYGILEVR